MSNLLYLNAKLLFISLKANKADNTHSILMALTDYQADRLSCRAYQAYYAVGYYSYAGKEIVPAVGNTF